MHKIMLVTSTLAILGFSLGGANAYDASDAFGLSSQNDLPISAKQSHSGTSEIVTSSTGTEKVTFGYPVRKAYNAADDFGFSAQNNMPVR